MKFRFVEICINTSDLNRALKFNDIIYSEIINHGTTTQIIIERKYISIFKYRCERMGIGVISLKNPGLLHKLKRTRYIKTFMSAMALALCILVLMSMFIWNIEFDGNYTFSNNDLNTFLLENNVKTGLLKKNVRCEDIEKLIRNNYSDVTWVCAEIKGTNLIIHVNENYNKLVFEKESNPYNIVSDVDGIITSIVTRSGIANVKKGNKIKKGDLLISGVIDTYNEFEELISTKYAKADGDIFAETSLEYSKKYIRTYNDKIYKKSYYVTDLFFGDKKLSLIKTNVNKNNDVIENRIKPKLLEDFYLPIVISVKKIRPFNYKESKYTNSELKQQINKDLQYYLMLLEQKGYKITEKNVKMKSIDYGISVSGNIKIIRPIGVINKIYATEEGTTKNERD